MQVAHGIPDNNVEHEGTQSDHVNWQVGYKTNPSKCLLRFIMGNPPLQRQFSVDMNPVQARVLGSQLVEAANMAEERRIIIAGTVLNGKSH